MNNPLHSDLSGQTALITGASSGIGAAAALALARHGASMLLHYNSNHQGAQMVLEHIQTGGGSGSLLQADLATRGGVEKLLTGLGDGKAVDILVNNAGSLIRRTAFLDITSEFWEHAYQLNVYSAVRITQFVLPGMVRRGGGVVVNVSSIAARTGGGIGAIPYASSKAALLAMTKGLAREFGPKGIRVNAVSPGTILTNYHRNFSTTEMLDAAQAATTVGRLGTSEEVAGVIVFLCSDAARYIHGQSIEVNGGSLMP